MHAPGCVLHCAQGHLLEQIQYLFFFSPLLPFNECSLHLKWLRLLVQTWGRRRLYPGCGPNPHKPERTAEELKTLGLDQSGLGAAGCALRPDGVPPYHTCLSKHKLSERERERKKKSSSECFMTSFIKSLIFFTSELWKYHLGSIKSLFQIVRFHYITP